MLAALAVLWYVSVQAFDAPTSHLPDLMTIDIDPTLQNWLFLGFFLAFAIKAPLLPSTHLAARRCGIQHTGYGDPADRRPGQAGHVRHAAVLSAAVPGRRPDVRPVIMALAVISIFYGGLVAIGQTDMKRLFGYVSISHFGFIVLGIFAFTTQAQVGSAFHMLGHGISTALLFMVAGYLITRRGTSTIGAYGGVIECDPGAGRYVPVRGAHSPGAAGLAPSRPSSWCC